MKDLSGGDVDDLTSRRGKLHQPERSEGSTKSRLTTAAPEKTRGAILLGC